VHSRPSSDVVAMAYTILLWSFKATYIGLLFIMFYSVFASVVFMLLCFFVFDAVSIFMTLLYDNICSVLEIKSNTAALQNRHDM